MTSAACWLAVACLLFLPRVVRVQIADPDLWGRISVGAVLFQAGHLPRVDDFSYTANGAPWIDHEWLSGVAFYAVLDAFGEPGLVLLKYALFAACVLLVFVLHGRLYRVAPIVTAAAVAGASPGYLLGFVATVRCQAFSFPLSLFFLCILEAVRLERLAPRHLLWLIPAAALWVNLHGGVAMGLLAVAVYGTAELVLGRPRSAIRMLALLPAMGIAMAILNPYGFDYLDFLARAWTLERTGISEWRPLLTGGVHAANAAGVALVGLGGALAAFGIWDGARRRLAGLEADPRRPDALAPSALLLLWIAMTLISHRILPFLALTLAAVLPLYGRLWLPASRLAERASVAATALSRPRVALPVLAALLLGGAASWGSLSDGRPLLASVLPSERTAGTARHFLYPEGAVRFLLDSPYAGNLLNPFSQGEFLYWTLYPRFRVAMDGRFEEVYDMEQFRDVYAFYHHFDPDRPERLAEFADRTGADFVMFRTFFGNHRVLARDPNWTTIYRDAAFALLARRELVEQNPHVPSAPAPEAGRAATIGDFFDADGAARFSEYP
jgi:hypothetical protein